MGKPGSLSHGHLAASANSAIPTAVHTRRRREAALCDKSGAFCSERVMVLIRVSSPNSPVPGSPQRGDPRQERAKNDIITP